MGETLDHDDADLAAWLTPGENGENLSPIDSPGNLISVLWTLLSRRFSRDYTNQLGINAPEFRLLAILSVHDGLHHRELVEQSNMDKAQVSRTITRMIERDMIMLEGENKTSRRFSAKTRAKLTPKGRKIFDAAMEIGRAHQMAILDALSQEERAMFHSVLHRLIAREKERASQQ